MACDLAGHGAGPGAAAAELERVAGWLRAHPTQELDVYGRGALVETFEARVAELLGVEAARWMPSGCMAQPIALRVWSDRAADSHKRRIGLHPTSHLELHECTSYARLHGLEKVALGAADAPFDATHIEAAGDLAAVVLELPAREIGGQVPSWEELVKISKAVRAGGGRLHLDGARLWQTMYDNKPLAEICALFDSVYVSFYKDIGALPGAMLLGPREFIDEAVVWQRRQGGTLYSAHANIVSAMLNLEERLPRMFEYRAKALAVASAIRSRLGRTAFHSITPDPPHASMLHLVLKGPSQAELEALRDKVALEHGIRIFSRIRAEVGDGLWYTEISFGDACLRIDDTQLVAALDAFKFE